MSLQQELLLIDLLDNSLEGDARIEAEQLLASDATAAGHWETLQLAVTAIVEAGLYEQVAAARDEYQATIVSTTKQTAVVRPMMKIALRVAAAVVLLVGASAVYKYASVSSNGLYNNYYNGFELNTTRGNDKTSAIENAYRNHNWKQVIADATAADKNDNKSLFLAGMADMELKSYSAAIASFQQVLDNNRSTGNEYFHDEAEYYQALALLANHEPVKAMALLNAIKANNAHTYHNAVANMSFLDLKIASQKESK